MSLSYIDFVRGFSQYMDAVQNRPNVITDSYGVPSPLFISDIKSRIKDSHIFKIENETVKSMLIQTKKPDADLDLNLPFENVFIDVTFTKEELNKLKMKCDYNQVIGILLRVGNLYAEDVSKTLVKTSHEYHSETADDLTADILEKQGKDPSPIGKSLRATIMTVSDKEVRFDTLLIETIITNPLFKNYNIEHKAKLDKSLYKFISSFCLSFLNFVNLPDIEYLQFNPTAKNRERRIKHGKIPLPSTVTIKLTGKLKQYVEALQKGRVSHRSFGYQFDVKGHFRHYHSDYYKNMQGKVRWIPPHTRGMGEYIKKIYEVE